MADLAYRFTGVNTSQLANEVRLLRESSSTFRALEEAAAAAGYRTIEVQMGAGLLPGYIAQTRKTNSSTRTIQINSDATGSWGVGGRQVTVGEVIAHELAHAVVPKEFDESGRYDFAESGKEGMWVRRQAGQVAVDLGLPGANNADHLITRIPVNETQGCTAKRPRGDGARDGVLFLDGSRGYNGIGSIVPPGSGSQDAIDSRRLAMDEPEQEMDQAAPDGPTPLRRLSRIISPPNGGADPSEFESRFEGWPLSPSGVMPRDGDQASPSQAEGPRDVRYLGRRDGNAPRASIFDAGAPAAQFVLPDPLNSSCVPTDWTAALAGLGQPNPMQMMPPLQAGGTPGISSNKPVRILGRMIADKPQASAFDTSAPAVPFVPANEVSSPDRRNAFVGGNDISSAAGGAGGSSFMRGPQGSEPSALLEYIQHLNQLGANKPQASIVDPDAPGASLAPSDSPRPMGGLAGRIAALAGIDPDNPDQPVPPPGGLLALLLAAQR